jgi:1-acyl-sn-glycerol-3-phosphate acyltransferase
MLCLLVVCLPLHWIWHPFTEHNPWPGRFLAGISKVLGLRITATGQRVTKGAFLLSNHVSWLDIPALAGLTGTAFVAQDGLAAHGWLRWLCSHNDTVFIARDQRGSVAAQVEQVRQAIRETGSLAVFPEGTTGDGSELLPFKSSLLSAIAPVPAGISVQPVWLDYGPQTEEIAWVGEEPGKDNFLQIASRSEPIGLTVHFLQPLEGSALDDRKTIAAAARSAILDARQLSATKRDQRVAL